MLVALGVGVQVVNRHDDAEDDGDHEEQDEGEGCGVTHRRHR